MLRNKEYYISRILPNIVTDGTKLVMCGTSAMCYNGMSIAGVYQPDILVENEELDGLRLAGHVNYYYVKDIDCTNYLTQLKEVQNILIPSRERAIVECIKYNLRFTNETYFCDSFERYLNGNLYNEKMLKEVANHFKVPYSDIEYWISESIDYNNY